MEWIFSPFGEIAGGASKNDVVEVVRTPHREWNQMILVMVKDGNPAGTVETSFVLFGQFPKNTLMRHVLNRKPLQSLEF